MSDMYRRTKYHAVINKTPSIINMKTCKYSKCPKCNLVPGKGDDAVRLQRYKARCRPISSVSMVLQRNADAGNLDDSLRYTQCTRVQGSSKTSTVNTRAVNKGVYRALEKPALRAFNAENSFTFYRVTACNATHGISNAFLSARPSVCMSNTWIVTKRQKLVSTFLNRMKDHLS